MSRQTSKKVAHDKAESSRLKRRSKSSRKSKKSCQLVKNLLVTDSSNYEFFNKDNKEHKPDPQSTSEYMDHINDEHRGEDYGTNGEEYTPDKDDEYGVYYGTVYTECTLCYTPGDEEYCDPGCPIEAMDLLGEYLDHIITRDEYLKRVMIRNNIIRNSSLASEKVTDNTKKQCVRKY